jgi:N utilization substance protein B
MEIQDPVTKDSNKAIAISLFKKNVDNKKEIDFSSDEEVASQVAQKEFKTYNDLVKKDFNQIKKRMIVDSGKIYDYYIKILNLLVRFSEFAGQGVGSKKSSIGEQSNLVNNLLIRQIKSHKEFESISLKNDLGWEGEIDIIRDWFKEIVVRDEEYIKYLKLEPTPDDDYEILNYLVRRIVFKNETILNYWENKNISWEEDQTIIRSLVIKTFKSLREKGEGFELSMLSYNWEDDKLFFEKLFDSTVTNGEYYQQLIAEKTKNWDFDRIAYTDRLILMLAISEMINFPSIPIKVTINEFIEVSKNYSTPKSKQFVNGVLDVIAVDLQGKGHIKKSGRGLIDNK